MGNMMRGAQHEVSSLLGSMHSSFCMCVGKNIFPVTAITGTFDHDFLPSNVCVCCHNS